jgi:ligand-binding sensor domain-containing protein
MRRLASLVILASVAGSASAEKAAEWRPVEVWRQPQGLPQNTVMAIHQSRDGYLWVGTKGGLTRFDGLQFTTWDDRNKAEIRENEVWALTEGDDGSLWVATYGGGVSRIRDGRFTVYTIRDGLANDYVTDVCTDRTGAIWMATDGGVSRWANGSFKNYTTADGLSHAALRSVLCDTDGSVWLGTSEGHVDRLDNGVVHAATVAGITAGAEVKALYRDRQKGLWIATTDGVVYVKDGRTRRFTTEQGLPSNWMLVVREDPSGTVWLGGEGGLARYVPDTGSFRAFGMDTTSIQTVKAIHADAEGNLWLGGLIDGLVRMRETLFVTYSEKDGLPAPYVTAVFEDSRRDVWLGTAKGLARLHGGEISTYVVPGPRASNRVTALAEDVAGRVWVGTNEGLYRVDSTRLVPVHYDERPLLNVRIILADAKSGLWIGTQYDGLLRYRDGHFDRYTTHEGLSYNAVRSLAQQADGTLWIGTKSGLTRLKDGEFTVFTEKDGLANASVESLYLDAAEALWIATRQGVNRYKNGRFATFTVAQGLHAGFVYCFVEDDEGHLWMNSSKGVFRVRKRDLDDLADGKARVLSSVAYGLEHGLSSTVGVISQFPVAVKARDGRVWFATMRGACVLDPRRLGSNPRPPAVHLEAVTVNAHAMGRGPVIEAAPGPGDLEIRYTGLSFTAPEKIAFKYKLEGYDHDWIEVGPRRVAYYTNIPPGPYRFQVVAANADRVWNTAGAGVDVVLAPHPYQTWWFRLLGVLALALGIVGLHSLRTRRLRGRERELSSRVQEALAQVKMLRGLLPICASCKKVRDDTGYWNQIETYIHERSEAEFSHSICPECLERFYPEFLTKQESSTSGF